MEVKPWELKTGFKKKMAGLWMIKAPVRKRFGRHKLRRAMITFANSSRDRLVEKARKKNYGICTSIQGRGHHSSDFFCFAPSTLQDNTNQARTWFPPLPDTFGI